MPELPEVETVRCGLAPFMEGAVIDHVEARRPDLRFPLPDRFVKRLKGQTIQRLARRGKYMIGDLSSEESLIMHLGMSGRFSIDPKGPVKKKRRPGQFVQAQDCNPKHDHIVMELTGPSPARVTYNDPRRFGFMDLVETASIDQCDHFRRMGPEPLGNAFSAAALNEALKGRTGLIKAALLDQQIVAGLGNIYVCEALFRAGVSPRRRAGSVSGRRGDRVYKALVDVLREAIEAGGSSLRDFAATDGELGYFQHNFLVYGREGENCVTCGQTIRRIVQSGRSTFFCPSCQR